MRIIEFEVRKSDTNEIIGYERIGDRGQWEHIRLNRTNWLLGAITDGQEYNKFVRRQFTGLTDKNGKKIFEGNIVRILYTDWPSKSDIDPRTLDQYLNDIAKIGVIIYDKYEYCVSIRSKKHDENFNNSIEHGKYGFIEVIGNIFDNPELLNHE